MGGCISTDIPSSSIIKKSNHSYYILGDINNGKSTILKSILLYNDYYNSRKLSISKLIQNIIKEFMFSLIDAIIEYESINVDTVDMDIVELMNRLQSTIDTNEFLIIEDILEFQKIYKLNKITNILKLIEFEYKYNIDYIVDSLERVLNTTYFATDEDILNISTTTVGNIPYALPDKSVTLYDVGAENNDVLKWDEYLKTCEHYIFIISLNFKNEKFEKSIELLHKCFSLRIPKMIILNKLDCFTEQLDYDISSFKFDFPDYNGESNTESRLNYIKSKVSTAFPNIPIYCVTSCTLNDSLKQAIDKCFVSN